MIRENYQKALTFLIMMIVAELFNSTPISYAYYEIDQTAYVTDVIDGDSFYIQGDEVRLADVSCPEYYETGGSEATEALTSFIEGETVYLDTDQLTGRGPYGRLIAVVYVAFNETHLVNVNYLMWVLGYAEVSDYTNNEFDPYSWTMFETYGVVESDTSETSDPYTELIITYSDLYYNYSAIVNDYNELVVEYNELLDEFIELDAEHTALENAYNELETNYHELENQEIDTRGIPGFPIIGLIIGFSYIIIQRREH